jgi:hypothetical protein
MSLTVWTALAAVTFRLKAQRWWGGCEVKTRPASAYEEEVCPTEVAKHVASARHLLMALRNRLPRSEDYSELQEAITKLDVALSLLTVNSGGML